MSAPKHSRETDLAFLENLDFMLETGESMGTAAARFGIKEASLQKRVLAAKKRLRGGDRRSGMARRSGKITGSNKSGAEVSYHLDADPQLVLAERG